MNNAMQLKAIVKNIAKEKKISAQLVLQNYMPERFLERVSLITLEVMLCEGILFECMDGTIRDLAALRGTYRVIPETEDAVRMMFEILQKADIHRSIILLDEPVSNSGRLKSLIADVGEDYSFEQDIRIIRDVDRSLYDKENVITTDSIILDHCISWINLASECLKEIGKRSINVWR